ncbi:helix-turn-helix domain-containing protein [Labilibacter sediminis]|nr:helix-turn-helix domain-containing protein [Labilibacter sediminis]
MISVEIYNSLLQYKEGHHAIIWAKDANGSILIGDKEFKLSSYNIITVGKQEKVQTQDASINGLIVYFSDADFPNSNIDSVCRIVLLYNYFNIHNQIIIEDELNTKFDQLFTLMYSEYNMQEAQSSNPVLSLLLQTLLLKMEQVIRNSIEINSNKNSIDEELLTHFFNALETNYTNHHQVKDYAELLNVTNRKLNDITKQYFGTTAKELISNKIYIEILRHLQFSSTSIKEIAYKMGFSSPYHLSNFFTKINGISPAAYRDKVKS